MSEQWATAEGFFKCPVPREKMDVPGLGLIWIYGLTSGEKDDYENRVFQMEVGDKKFRMENARAILLQMAVRNQHGARIFSEKELGKLRTVPGSITEPIIKVIRRLSAMDADEIDKLVKNSLIDAGAKESGSGSE